jgi:hypothetical protein
MCERQGEMTMALTRTPRRTAITLALVGVLAGATVPGPVTTLAADAPPTRLLFWDLPNDVYAGRPFDVVVAIVAFPDGLGVVVTDGTSATVTLALDSSPVPGASLACASGMTLPTETSGSGTGTVTFSGCTIDQVGEPYVLRAAASNVMATTMPPPVLEDVTSVHHGPVRVRPAIEAPQDSIQVTITHDGAAEWVTWGDTVTVQVRFTERGANRSFQLQQTTRQMTTWWPVADLVTDANGLATYSYRPTVSTRFRAVFQGAPDLPAGTSASPGFLLYAYAKQVPTQTRPTVIRRGTSVTFATTVRPLLPDLPPARVAFLIYHRVSGTWKLASQRAITVDSTGVARMTLKFGGLGEWYVRSRTFARWAGDPETAPAVSWTSRLLPIARYSVR